METTALQRFRRALEQHRDNLLTWWRSDAPHKATCLGDREADGQPPEACMPVLAEVDHTLDRIDAGTFGRCVVCNGEVEPERLALDFTVRQPVFARHRSGGTPDAVL